jgi:hypothetical protein
LTLAIAPAVVPAQVPARSIPAWWWRWLPFGVGLAVVSGLLIAADTGVVDILRYIAYGTFALALPGTLVYRALRRTPHTFVEDVAIGIAVGIVLELAAWAVFSALDLRSWVRLWPAVVIAVFAAVPGLRRHWRVSAYTARPSLAWSWALAGVVIVFTGYLYAVFLSDNPILPNTESTDQFLDLPYQLSLAAQAKIHFPPDLPQVAGEPLYYHWFAFVHLAMTSMVGGIDLPVVAMRLMVPAVCALIAVLTAVTGWRLTGRPWVGLAAAAMFFVIGDFDFADAIWPPFGTQTTFVVWVSLSMTMSWALLVPLIAVTGDLLRRKKSGAIEDSVPRIGPGAYVLVALFALASSATKASSLPVLAGGLVLACLAVLVAKRRIPWVIVTLGAMVAVSQLAASAVIFHFETYGLSIDPLIQLSWAWAPQGEPRPLPKQVLLIAATVAAFLLHLQLRGAGIVSLFWIRKARLEPVHWFLLGGAIAGPVLFVMFSGYAASWFGRAGFPFSLILSAWGFALVFERARLAQRGKALLAAGTTAFALALTAITWKYARGYPTGHPYSPLLPMLELAAVLGVIAVAAAVIWWLASRRLPGLKRRGGVVLLSAALVAGAPGLLMDAKFSWGVPGGPYGAKALVPASVVEAARWVRDHSDADDVVATNSHCAQVVHDCAQAASFYVSAYSERSVLLEGWAFAPRLMAVGQSEFWDDDLARLNEDAFYVPTAQGLSRLRSEHRVRYLIAVRQIAPESSRLRELAELVYDNGNAAVYDLDRVPRG